MPREKDRLIGKESRRGRVAENGDFSWGVLLYTEVAHTHTYIVTQRERERERASGRDESQMRVRATAIPHSRVANAEFCGGRNQFLSYFLPIFFTHFFTRFFSYFGFALLFLSVIFLHA